MRRKPIGQGTSVKNTLEHSIAVAAVRSGRSADGVDGGGRHQARRGAGLRRGGPLHARRDAAVQRVHPGRRPHRGLPQGQAEAAVAGHAWARCIGRRRYAKGEEAARAASQSLILPAFAQDNLNKAQRPACPGRPAARHGTVFAGGLCSRLNGAKRHAAADRVCHAVRRCGVCGDSHGRRDRAFAPIAATTRCCRIGALRVRGRQDAGPDGRHRQQRVPAAPTTRPTSSGRWATAAPTSNART